MGCTSCVLKLILGIVNSIFLLVGLLITALGGIILALSNNTGFITFLEDTIKTIIDKIGLVDPEMKAYLEFDFSGVLRPAGIVILIFGLLVLGVAVVGYVGLSCSDIVLIVYLVIIAVLLAIQIIMVAVFFSGALNDEFRKHATRIIEHEYKGIADGSIYSVGPNIIMHEMKCCGLDNYTDFHKSQSWPRHQVLKDEQGNEYNATLQTPVVCCKVGTSEAVEDFDCATKPNINNSNYLHGCWTEITAKIDEYRTPGILICSAVIVVQAILIIFVLIIVCDD